MRRAVSCYLPWLTLYCQETLSYKRLSKLWGKSWFAVQDFDFRALPRLSVPLAFHEETVGKDLARYSEKLIQRNMGASHKTGSVNAF
jgi:hypothetical protein